MWLWKKKLKEIQPQDFLRQGLEDNDLDKIILALSQDEGLIQDPKLSEYHGNDLVHLIMIKGFSVEFILRSLNLLKEVYKYNPHQNLNFRKYTPLMSLMINNPKFYENYLGEILVKLIPDFYPKEELPHNLGSLSVYYWLDESQIPKPLIFQRYVHENPVKFYNTLFLKHEWNKGHYPNLAEFLCFKKEIDSISFESFVDCIVGRSTKPLRRAVFSQIVTASKKGYSKIPTISFFSSLIKDDNKLETILNFIEEQDRHDYYQRNFKLEDLNYISNVNKMPNLSQRLRVQRFDNYNNPNIVPQNQTVFEHCQDFINKEGIDRFIKFFFSKNNFNSFEVDTLLMYKMYNQEPDLTLDLGNFRDLKDLHDFLSKEISKRLNKPYSLKQENITELDQKTILENVTIFVPQENTDIIQGGLELNICIGMGRYAQGVVSKYWNIVFLKKDGEFFAAFQFNKKGMIEAKLKNNQTVPYVYIQKFQDLIKDLEIYSQDETI